MKGSGFAVARLRNLHAEIGADMPGVAPQHDDPIGEQDGFFNVVGDDEDAAGRHRLLGPKLEEFAAQVLGRENVEGGERLVHEKDLGLDDQRTGKADPLLHASGEFFRICRFKAVQADRVEHPHAARAALLGLYATRLQRRLYVFKHGEPRKQRKALEHDRDVDLGLGDRPAVPVHLSAGGPGKPGKHAQHRRFA